MLILYAEDDPEDADVFKEVLKTIDPGIACIIATNGEDALCILEDAIILPDIIFLDFNMPLMDGKECLKRIRRKPEWVDIPVIVYTTSRNDRDFQALREIGAAETIIKPNSFEEIYQCLFGAIHKWT